MLCSASVACLFLSVGGEGASSVLCSWVWRWVLMCAVTAWCTYQGAQDFLWNLVSFLAFHRYHIVIRILLNKTLEVELEIRARRRISCTPSSSWGRLSMRRGGSVENQTARGRWRWKNRWASSSTAPQAAQCLSMWMLYLDALSAVASALLMSLHVKALIRGGNSLLFHALCKILLAWWLILLDPYCGRWTSCCLLRCL